MIIPDINLLVYAYNDQAPRHAEARVWWEGLLNGTTPVGLTWLAMAGFIRLMTHPRVLAVPMAVPNAASTVRSWLDQAPARIIQPGAKFQELFFAQIVQVGAGGNLTTDAQLAAIAIEHQAVLHSCDADFSRFPGLRWKNPLPRR
jgi:uncharacterized protein